MGGHSTSTIRRLADGGLNFSGVISTRDGGFASCSTIEQPLHFPANLAAFNVSVTGNGELYKLTFKTSDSIWEPIWQADLPRASLVKGVRHNFLLPLSSFKANRMGSPVSESRLLASEIVSIGLNLALIDENGDPNPHFESGPFELLVHRIDLVTSHPQARELPTTVVPAADGGASNPAAVIAAAPSSPSSPSSQLLVSFGRAASGTATWLVTNDPVMGGRSHASLAVGESSSTFNGTCAIVPSLHAPGFCKMSAVGSFADASPFFHGGALYVTLRSSTQTYAGFKVDFSAAGMHPSPGQRHGVPAFKAGVTLPGTAAAEFVTVRIPWEAFSSDHSEYTGRCDTQDPGGLQHHCCSREHPENCPTAAHLAHINGISVWAEGVEGHFEVELQSIEAGL